MQSVGIFDPVIKRMPLRGGLASDLYKMFRAMFWFLCYPLQGLKVSILLFLRMQNIASFGFCSLVSLIS